MNEKQTETQQQQFKTPHTIKKKKGPIPATVKK